jgi:hypothetical protein
MQSGGQRRKRGGKSGKLEPLKQKRSIKTETGELDVRALLAGLPPSSELEHPYRHAKQTSPSAAAASSSAGMAGSALDQASAGGERR